MAPAPVTPSPEIVEQGEIQGLVYGGFGALKEARFLLLRVKDAARARAYIDEIGPDILKTSDLRMSDANPDEYAFDVAFQLAFTAAGLEAFGVPKPIVDRFAREFTEGLDDDVRSDSLGDRGHNDPRTWSWGNRAFPVHALLLVYAKNRDVLKRVLDEERPHLDAAFDVIDKTTKLLPESKEHFGWRDGISTPVQEKLGAKVPDWTDPIRIGEFVLGYKNEYKNDHDTYSESPVVSPAEDPNDFLPLARDGVNRDLGKNGSYLVYREMTQDVAAFWRYCFERSEEPGADQVQKAIALGAKMVGRWPGGAPLTTSPDGDDPAQAKRNDFRYEQNSDLFGMRCPVGAHIRRTNPRDHLGERGMQNSVEMVRKHMMLRRGRPFGEPFTSTMLPADVIAKVRANEPDPEQDKRGLHFICLVGHISRQFEFVQRTWVDTANFNSLFKDGDPIAAARRDANHENCSDEFTVPAMPVRRKYKGMPAFTRVVGGGYFFLPSISALKFIAQQVT